jgi:hypothetical protein
MIKSKRMAAALSAAALVAGGLAVAAPQVAEANACTLTNCGKFNVNGSSSTCVDVYDGWSGTKGSPPNVPLGTRRTVCSGNSPKGTDWDAVCWPYGYTLHYRIGSRGKNHTTTNGDKAHCKKFSGYTSIVYVYTRKS